MTTDSSTGGRHGQRIQRDDFVAAAWLPGPHIPTIWASIARRLPALKARRERIELRDGDFVDLAWGPESNGPLVVILHGLEGSQNSPYAHGLLLALAGAGYRGVLMHFRGCSGEVNRLDRNYHSGDTGDIDEVIKLLMRRDRNRVYAVIGFSLGGNVLLKWLGENGADTPLTTAVAVSVPFELGACATRLNQGFSRLYQWRLVRSMQQKYRRKFEQRKSPLKINDAGEYKTFWDYDNAVTAPLHGFKNVDDYYEQSSCRQYLKDIRIPTLILHAYNDPFVPPSAIPPATELSPTVSLELTQGGGHVGFIGRDNSTRCGYWLETPYPRAFKRPATRRPVEAVELTIPEPDALVECLC